MPLHDEDIPALTVLLSPERLGPLMRLTGSTRAAIELHQETLGLGASMMSVTATVEIALRNAICENLSQHFGAAGWLLRPPAPFQWKEPERKKVLAALDSARRAEYAKLTQANKGALDSLAFPQGRPANISHLKRAQERRKQIVVTEGKVIAELTLFFWKRLYGPDYEQALWRTSLKKTFPNKRLKRANVAENMEQIYQSRNRLAHHEPVLHKRFHDTMNAIQFVIENLGAQTASGNMQLARLVANEILEVNTKADVLHKRLDGFRVRP
jgi:hypothetical protein